jgi:hypothetical protein
MTGERYVLLGLAPARASWFVELSRWATSGALPAEFVKALSVEEVTARLRSGRPFSALIVDASVGGCDRDLIETATAQGSAVVVVDREPPRRQWADLGAAAVLPIDFGRDALVEALRAIAQPVARADDLGDGMAPLGFTGPSAPTRWRGRLVAVTGSGGSGRSTLAMALATGLGADPRDRGSVLLADLALNAHQGLLHDCGDVVPGISELVDAYRRTALPVAEIRRLCFAGGSRGYDLLLGLRRQRDWTALRPHAVAAALDGLRAAYRIVVADVDSDIEGEAESGSIDIEERNQLARTSIINADLVTVVGVAGVSGLYSQIRLLGDLTRMGVPPERILTIVNRAPRSPRRRAEISAAVSRLLGEMLPGTTLAATPIFLPERRRIEEIIADAGRPPSGLVEPVTGAVRAMLERLGTPHPSAGIRPADDRGEPPVAVAPGSLGSWSEASGEHTP